MDAMGLDELRARLDSLLASQGLSTDRRSEASGLHAALVEFKVVVGQHRDALAKAERELEVERRQETDAERRGRLAADIGDTETVRIATEYTARHRERVILLERKVGVVRDELAYAEREYETLAARYQAARQGTPGPGGQAAEAVSDHEFDALKAKSDREASEQAVKAQLEMLKKKLGKSQD
jgi:hypothetical protein